MEHNPGSLTLTLVGSMSMVASQHNSYGLQDKTRDQLRPEFQEFLDLSMVNGQVDKHLHPRKLTCPQQRDYFKRTCHLPTISFQGIC